LTSKPPTSEGFLTTEEVLEYLQVNLRTVYRLIKSNAIPAVRVGRQWRFKKQDIDAWLEGRKRGAPPPARQGRRRLLLVDDDEGTRILLTKMLERQYDVETAVDGNGALEALQRGGAHYDLMISDLNMPGMDGIALIREVRNIRPEMPIIIITGYSTETSAIDAVNLRVAGYLTKPLKDTQVLEAAARALGAPAA
jgi:two-component system, cell cycle sensor histidine kinase and response regulator CckA